MVACPPLVIPTDTSLTGGCDSNCGLRKCPGGPREVPHSHPLCPLLLGWAGGAGLARSLREAASSPHLGVGLGPSPGAEPRKPPDGRPGHRLHL